MDKKGWLIGGLILAGGIVAGAVWSGKAKAADLGGNCCADLEERIAELEATTARKGNRKVSLHLYGQISKALLWTDGLGVLPSDKGPRVIDNGNSNTRVGLRGEAKISPSMSAGFVFEYQFDDTKGAALGPAISWLETTAELRKSAVWINTAMGKFTVGKFDMATDAIVQIDTSNSAIASKMMSFEPLWSYIGLGGLPIVGGNLLNPAPFSDIRGNIVRYDSPTIAGFTVAAAWGGGQTLSGDDAYDVALRWSGEGAGFRMAFGIGYRVSQFDSLGGLDEKTISGSASVKHMVSGLFVTVAAADQQDNPIFGDIQMLHLKAGVERKFVTDLGATTIYGEIAQHKLKTMGIDTNFYGAGIVQNIEAAAMDVFLSVRQYDSDIMADKATVGLAGVRINF